MRRTRCPLVASNRCQEVNIMKLVSALVGLAALGGVALSSAAASATPVDVPASTTGIVVPPGYVCNEWGHCWHRHYAVEAITIRIIGVATAGTVIGVVA